MGDGGAVVFVARAVAVDSKRRILVSGTSAGNCALARLRADGLVVSERQGRSISYALADERTARVVRLLHKEFC